MKINLGPGTEVRLLFPYTLANDGFGNLYIGDHNFIRKLDPFGSVSSLYSTADRVEKVPPLLISNKSTILLKIKICSTILRLALQEKSILLYQLSDVSTN